MARDLRKEHGRLGEIPTMLETDYLVIGAGALGLAFADTLTRESNATVTLADRHHTPGGHWNFAYDFVRLHQPSEFYGVESVPLGSGEKDTDGWNSGLYKLATGAEVVRYFQTVMSDHLLPSGQVTYLPRTNYLGQGRLKSLETGEEIALNIRRKIVDATYFGTTIPSLHLPSFQVSPDVHLISPNELSRLLSTAGPGDADGVCILGAGKTAMDVGVHLLESGVLAEQITWVIPRDSWLMNRANLQPGDDFFESTIGAQARQMQAFAEAQSAQDLFHRLEDAGVMLRIFPEIEPSMFHCAIISEGEIGLLQQITQTIRKGHVNAIDESGMVLEHGRVPMPANTVYIDCTASAVTRLPQIDIFQDRTITLQIARACQPAFSAALIGFIETLEASDAQKNELCRPLALPDTLDDYFDITLKNLTNQYVWSRTPEIRDWLQRSRLDGFAARVSGVGQEDTNLQALLQAFRAHTPEAIANIQKLMQRRA